MTDGVRKLHAFLAVHEYPILTDAGAHHDA